MLEDRIDGRPVWRSHAVISTGPPRVKNDRPSAEKPCDMLPGMGESTNRGGQESRLDHICIPASTPTVL